MLLLEVSELADVPAAALEAAVMAELDRIHRDGITDAELGRARALIETSFVTSLQSAAERADQLSRFATYFGDPAVVNEQVARYQRVTAADVGALCRERLGADNRALLVYVPQAGAAAVAA